MQSNVEVLPPEKKPARLMLSGQKRPGWVPPAGDPSEVLGLVNSRRKGRGGRPSKYANAEELKQKAFVMYQGMGEQRSLAKVAIALSLPADYVRRWSSRNKWNDQIAPKTQAASLSTNQTWEDMAKSKRRRFQERLWGRIDFLLTELEKDDALSPEERQKQKTSLYSVQELLKMLMTDSKITGQDIENEKGRKEIESPDSGNGKGNKTGVMVNVIFKG